MNKVAPVLFLALGLLALPAAAATEPGGTVLAGFSFRAPDGWQALSTDDAALTRLADWSLPGGAEVVVFRFGNGQPGDVSANLNQWAGSVTTPQGTPAVAKVSQRRIGSYPFNQIEAFGTYLLPESGAPGLPPSALPGSGLVGAVLELPTGPLYVRLTGTEAAVRHALPELARFLESVRPPPSSPAPKS